MNKVKRQSLVCFLTLSIFFIITCDIQFGGGKGDPVPIPQTTVLEIRMTPDTVAVNDTLLIECIIKDSLDSRFKFDWRLNDFRLEPVEGKLDGNKIKWIAKNLNFQSDTFQLFGSVIIDNGSKDSVEVRETISIIIKK